MCGFYTVTEHVAFCVFRMRALEASLHLTIQIYVAAPPLKLDFFHNTQTIASTQTKSVPHFVTRALRESESSPGVYLYVPPRSGTGSSESDGRKTRVCVHCRLCPSCLATATAHCCDPAHTRVDIM